METVTVRRKALVTLGFLAAGAVLAYTRLPLMLPGVCLFKRVTGLPCCGCGMTHAFCAMSHGDFLAAADFNPASLPLALLVVVGSALVVMEALRNREYVKPLWKKWSNFVVFTGAPILMASWVFELWKVFSHHASVV